MNAAERFARALPAEGLRRIAALELRRFGEVVSPRPRLPLDLDEAYARVIARWGADLCGLLNALVRGELAALARVHGVVADGRSPELRARLWERGAALETGGVAVGALQPRPVLLGGHLVVQAAPRGLYPPSARWPRAVPPPVAPQPPAEEPETLDELLAAADRALGVRLGRRGRDKGAWGVRAAALLGVVERGAGEPDWRGDVELKTVAVARDGAARDRSIASAGEAGARDGAARDRSIASAGEAGARDGAARDRSIASAGEAGVRDSAIATTREAPRPPLWRVVEDPAIAMTYERSAIAKLQRTLWLARADVDDGDATLVGWYLLEWDAPLARLARRYLHERPKGPAGTDARAVYLHKRFFADAGFLATLNGPGGSLHAGPP